MAKFSVQRQRTEEVEVEASNFEEAVKLAENNRELKWKSAADDYYQVMDLESLEDECFGGGRKDCRTVGKVGKKVGASPPLLSPPPHDNRE